MSLSKLAQDIVLDAIRDQAHDVMGLGEQLEDQADAENWGPAKFEARVAALSEELEKFAARLEAERDAK